MLSLSFGRAEPRPTAAASAREGKKTVIWEEGFHPTGPRATVEPRRRRPRRCLPQTPSRRARSSAPRRARCRAHRRGRRGEGPKEDPCVEWLALQHAEGVSASTLRARGAEGTRFGTRALARGR